MTLRVKPRSSDVMSAPLFQNQLLLEHAFRSLRASKNEGITERFAASFLEHGAEVARKCDCQPGAMAVSYALGLRRISWD